MVPEMGSDILNKTEGKNNVRLPWLQNSYFFSQKGLSSVKCWRRQSLTLKERKAHTTVLLDLHF